MDAYLDAFDLLSDGAGWFIVHFILLMCFIRESLRSKDTNAWAVTLGQLDLSTLGILCLAGEGRGGEHVDEGLAKHVTLLEWSFLQKQEQIK